MLAFLQLERVRKPFFEGLFYSCEFLFRNP